MFDYDKFYRDTTVDTNSDPARFSRIASLCRGSVLDIGCCFAVLSDFYSGDYTGVDFSKEALKKANEVRRKDAQFMIRDCSDLTDFDFSNYNTIVLTEFLEHFENDEKILDPIFKNAKPGTRIIITCPNGPRVPDPSHLRQLTIPELRKRFSPHGKVKFYNGPGANRQIMMTCDLGEKNEDLLSLVMIVKDEEKGLEPAILSCIEFVDNIVIAVDSRSADKTLEIAKLYADTVKTFDGQDDFSGARNFAHEGVKTKWILFLDGHEYVSEYSNLERFLNSESEGLLVSVELENGFVFPNPRIYKNGVHFEGKIHEKQMCKNTELYPNFKIIHNRVGFQSSEAIDFRNKQRDDMVPRLLGEELKKNPRNARALFHLGCYWQARDNFKKALNYYTRYLKVSFNKQERGFVLFHCAICYMSINRSRLSLYYSARADREMPNRGEIAKLKGMIFYQRKQGLRAIECFVSSFHSNDIVTLYRPWFRNDSDTGSLIGECYFNLKNYQKAYIAFDRSASLCKKENLRDFIEKRSKLMKEMFLYSFKK